MIEHEPSQASDESLLATFIKGDNSALASLAARHEAGMYGLACGLLNGRTDLAKDAVQDAWVRVIRYGATFDARSSFKTWIYRIVINRCHDLRAAERSGPASFRLFSGSAPPEPSAPPPPAPFQSDEIREEVRSAVRSLPAASQLIVLLCYHRDFTHDEAASVLGIPVGTLKSRLHAALEALRGSLQKERSA
ncbi:MAG: RNA polymerase sigma factor [Phycisphaerales bacterium]